MANIFYLRYEQTLKTLINLYGIRKKQYK